MQQQKIQSVGTSKSKHFKPAISSENPRCGASTDVTWMGKLTENSTDKASTETEQTRSGQLNKGLHGVDAGLAASSFETGILCPHWDATLLLNGEKGTIHRLITAFTKSSSPLCNLSQLRLQENNRNAQTKPNVQQWCAHHADEHLPETSGRFCH